MTYNYFSLFSNSHHKLASALRYGEIFIKQYVWKIEK